MHIIRLSKFCGNRRSSDLGSVRTWLPASILASMVGFGGFWLGQQQGLTDGGSKPDNVLELLAELAEERRSATQIREEVQSHLDALALRIANLQAHLMRVDALGERLVHVGKLDPGEFDFTIEPATGGPNSLVEFQSQDAAGLNDEIDALSQLLQDRERKLQLMEDLLMNRDLRTEVLPSGKPVVKGWVASAYGSRTDPFSGKKGAHHGVDFAAKPGTDVVAVASGVVTRAETVSGYGNLVEVKHADGYSTRYAHNQRNLVRDGDVVSKGQTIALLGSTGKSTGPHVHFEVRRDGQPINPRQFIQPE